jgi:hypothetical protein
MNRSPENPLGLLGSIQINRRLSFISHAYASDTKRRLPSCLLTPSADRRPASLHQALPAVKLTPARLTTLPAPPHPRPRARASVPIFFSWDESSAASRTTTSPRGGGAGVPVFLHPTGSWTALVLYWWLWPYQWTFFCRSWLSPSEKYSLHFSACKPRLTIMRKVWCKKCVYGCRCYFSNNIDFLLW